MTSKPQISNRKDTDDDFGLSPLQQAFAHEYVRCGLNGSKAYQNALRKLNRAAVNTDTAKANAYKLLNRHDSAKLHAYIRELMNMEGVSDHHANYILAALLTDANPFVRLRAVEIIKKMHGTLTEAFKLYPGSNGAIIIIGGETIPNE